jgi:exodeoxyribonuclease V alpha subunit
MHKINENKQHTAVRSTFIQGEVDSITYQNTENGWGVIRLREDQNASLLTVTGHFPNLTAGEYLRIEGYWSQHKSFGMQFKSERSQFIRPESKSAILRYLSSGMIKGIGEKTAAKIVNHLGSRTFAILDHTPEKLVEVPGIGEKKAQTIIEAWQKNQAFRDIEVQLTQAGLSPRMIHRIIRVYGQSTLEVLETNPYRLIADVAGIGFLTADKLALNCGIEPDSELRIEAALVYAMQQSEDQGHCFLFDGQLESRIKSLLGLQVTDMQKLLAKLTYRLNEKSVLISEQTSDQQLIHFQSGLRIAEENLANNIKKLLANPLQVDSQRVDNWITRYCQKASIPLSNDQLNAVKMAATNRVFILTGGPGVGKTTTANAIIRLFKAMEKTVALCAPTGRAAQRLTEISGIEAKTVHRLLEWAPQNNGFAKDELNPLTSDVIILDEASMLDIRIADALVCAITAQSQLILIGDTDQLPSVGPGNILHDLIHSEIVPSLELSEIFRQASQSDIVRIAHTINQGQIPEFNDEPQCDCRFLDIQNVGSITKAIKDLTADILPNKSGYNPISDIQILTPMNRGDLGTKQLNFELQKLLNPGSDLTLSDEKAELSLRQGDKVIQNSNNYDLNVFNGDIGIVQHSGVDGGKTCVAFGQRLVYFDKEDTYDLRLAYAITIHKSQGSEFPVVIIPLHAQHFMMLERNLIYTALTRARKLAIFVGDKKALTKAIQNQTSKTRQTKLLERLRGIQ